ncbi:MAG: hypothetical protein NTV06_06145 [candidate division Zixibacteria bacterium]|nr:hypothetical protein [candidate division Zixibacteria bacterium]
MFYLDKLDKEYRFGDIIRGFALAEATIESPPNNRKFCVDITSPEFCVILTPCCSIGDKVIALTPLDHVKNSFFSNPYFAGDLTNINRRMLPEEAFPPAGWEKLNPEDRRKRVEEGSTHACLEYFIFADHELLPKYIVDRRDGKIETNHYMIDFRKIYRVNCSKIINAKNAPSELKVLQLTIGTRSELRDKMAFYFSRPAEEDMSFNV